ncbi:Heat shock 70 kDa protein [Triticum urartu]|uniref:Heat shock 70 kDa protein n=1 Tax=Triticum urartu TaxID=4572 RepID=M7ZE10_TRIUA|nr:Heat shock 70 kDa protein [Triticum urartu]
MTMGEDVWQQVGTTYSFVGVWQQVDIMGNYQGNRTTPSYVAFTDTERLTSNAAKNQVAMNPTNTVFGSQIRYLRIDGLKLRCYLRIE